MNMESSRSLFGSYVDVSQFNLVMARYHKKCLYKPRHPDLYKDNVKTKTKIKDRVYANEDYIHKNVVVQPNRNYVQLEGGLLQPPELAWNFHAKTEEDDVVEMAIACEMMDALFQPSFTWNDKRSHIRFTTPDKALYCPLVHKIITTPSLAGSYHVNVNRSFIRPDYSFVKDAGHGLKMWMLHMETVDCQMPSIHVNPGFVNIRLLAAEMRDSFIRHLAKTFRKQQNLIKMTFEHAFLQSTDALRILLAVALGAGYSLQKLYICNLFFPKSLPLETESDYFDIYDEIEYDPMKQPVYSDEIKSKAWEKLFMKPFLDRMPATAIDDYFCMALSSLSNLTVLMVNYSWFSKGNGLYLLRLESLRKAVLRKLILLISSADNFYESRQVINEKAWAYAVQMCPCLQVHLILLETAAFIDLKKVLVRSMPLVSVHFSNTYLLEDVGKRKPWSLNYFTRYLGSYFCCSLEIINMTVWRSSTTVDMSLVNMIMKCSLLRVFIYRGQLDKFDTIPKIFEFLLEDSKMRIREIGFFVVDDPCRPTGWTEAVKNVKDEYFKPLALKGITISLDVWKL